MAYRVSRNNGIRITPFTICHQRYAICHIATPRGDVMPTEERARYAKQLKIQLIEILAKVG